MTAPRTDAIDVGADANQPGMPAEHALLGLLALSESGAGHGYELARHFGADAPLGNVIRLEPGMVYHHLKKLERFGWVSVLPEAVPGRPARRRFALTPAGRSELSRWLAEPVAHTREIRLEFLVKLYLALLLNPATAVRLVGEQREICARLVESLRARLRHGGEGGVDDDRETRFSELVLDMRQAQTQAALDWLDRVEREAAAAVASESTRGHRLGAGP
jgi:PadR family transcriptional regulator AphA